MPQINQRHLSSPSLPPFSRCIITKITIMKILSASQPPSPHFPLPLSCLSALPPTAWLTPAGGNSSQWNWGCNSVVLLKYICPLQTLCVGVLVGFTDEVTKGGVWNNLVSFISNILHVGVHKYDLAANYKHLLTWGLFVLHDNPKTDLSIKLSCWMKHGSTDTPVNDIFLIVVIVKSLFNYEFN